MMIMMLCNVQTDEYDNLALMYSSICNVIQPNQDTVD